MTRLFGTDGIRGVANVDLRPTLAYALGRATAHRRRRRRRRARRRPGHPALGRHVRGGDHGRGDLDGRRRPRRGRRARRRPSRSSPRAAAFAAGIMVSASHNPAEDNGLKVLDASGLKLDDDLEDELEALILRADELPGVAAGGDRARRRRRRALLRALPRAPARRSPGRLGRRAPRRARHRERGRLRASGRRSCGRPGPASP